MKWETEAEQLYTQGKSWNDIAVVIQPKYFPNKSQYSVGERVRNYVRKSPVYRGAKMTHEERVARKQLGQSRPAEGQRYDDSDGTMVSTKFITLRDGEQITPTELMRLHGLNPADWQVMTYVNNYWNTQVKGGTLQISYQSKLTVKPIKGIRPDMVELKELFAEMQRTPTPRVEYVTRSGTQMAEVNIADLHLGKLCWHGEQPDNYDYKIARDTYYRLITDVVDQLRGKSIKYILFVWSNDFFNSDNGDQTTSGGTRQDTDIREKKLYRVGVEMLTRGIEMLCEIAPVETFYTPSNHDELCAYHALLYLESWFRNDPNVTVDPSAYPRKYHLFGNTLIGFTHGSTEASKGSKEKASRLASLMPIEAKEYWSQAQFYEMHAAHLHSEQMIQEINGVIVRRIASPTAPDDWHTKSGYIGSVRKMQVFIYDEEKGLLHIINTPV